MTQRPQTRGGDVSVSFEGDFIKLPVDAILPIRPFAPAIRASKKFKQIMASVREVGLVVVGKPHGLNSGVGRR